MMETLSDQRLAAGVRDFLRAPEIGSRLGELTARLPAEAELYVVGGAIRNRLIDAIHGRAPATCDIDIFIGGLPGDFPLRACLAGLDTRVTDLKGIRWRPEGTGYAFDLCLIARFLVIERCRLPPNLESLLLGIDFSINAIAHRIGGSGIWQRGCIEAVKRRIIDFNGRLIPEPRLMVYRILLMRHKTRFRLSATVFDFLRQHLDLETLNWLKRVCAAKLGKARAAAIGKDCDAVCTAASYAAWLESIQ